MNIYGIVCEYNPFHNGHLYHIEESKRRGADSFVCIMSGNFVQRGDFAVMQKHARAEAAVRCGADVVIELPLPWSISSAEHFAYGAVSVLDALGVVSHISFGAENEDITRFLNTAKILLKPDFNDVILTKYSSGISYAKAREYALAEYDLKLASLIKSPNNILAIEYLKALLWLKSAISPIAIVRHGVAHDDNSVFEGTASASYIRSCIENTQDFSELLPATSLDLYNQEVAKGHAPVSIKEADRAIISVLKRFTPEDFARYGDVSEGLEFRLFDAISKSTSLNEAITKAKTKRYTHSRIRRIFLNAFLGVEETMLSDPVPYARILAFNDTGRKIIKDAKKTSKIPIITRPSSIKFESQKAQALLALEKRADDIYSLFMKNPVKQGSTFTRSPIYVENNN